MPTSPTNSAQELQRFLEKHGLDQFTSVEIIGNWVKTRSRNDDEMEYLTMLAGLMKNSPQSDVEELCSKFTQFLNECPRKFLGLLPPKNFKNPLQQDTGNKVLVFGENEIFVDDEPHMFINTHSIADFSYMEHYTSTISYMKSQKFHEAMESLEECFKLLREKKITDTEIFRFYANKALIHFNLGQEEYGRNMLDIAIELNPNYTLAREAKRQYDEGKLAPLIMKGMLRSIAEGKKLQRWDFDEIQNEWSVAQILEQLEEFGIRITQEEFRRKAKKYISIDDFSKEYLEPQFKGDSKDEDFIWMAVYGLWKKWCSDYFTLNRLNELPEKLHDLTSKDSMDAKKVTEVLNELFDYILNAREVIKKWPTTYEFYEQINNLYNALFNLFGTAMESEVTRMVETLKKDLQHPNLDTIKIRLEFRKGNNIEKDLAETINLYPYDPDVYFDMASEYYDEGLDEKVDESLKKALATIQKREKDGKNILEHRLHSIYEDYTVFFEKLDEYRNVCDKGWLEEIADIASQVEQKKEELSRTRFDFKDETFQEKMKELVQQNLKEDIAWQYYEYLKQFQLNFKTKEPVSSEIYVTDVNGIPRKLGRNDYCLCGSGKKYKKCCQGND